MPDNVCKCLTMACEFQVVSLGFRNLKNSRARRRLTCKTQDQAKTAEDRDSESSDDSDGSKQYSNNTKTANAVTARRFFAAAIRRATTGRVEGPRTADHAEVAGGWSLWVVSTG